MEPRIGDRVDFSGSGVVEGLNIDPFSKMIEVKLRISVAEGRQVLVLLPIVCVEAHERTPFDSIDRVKEFAE